MEPMSRLAPRRINSIFICTSCRRRSLFPSFSRPDLQIRRRDLHASPPRLDNQTRDEQALPLGDFYADMLASPIPPPPKLDIHSSLPSWVRSGDETKEERAAKIFGAVRGSGYERRTASDTPDATWRTINGVPIPPRPAEPDNCCMSGCVHCVWDDFRDDIEGWARRLHEAQAKSQGREGSAPKVGMQRREVHEASGSMDDDGGGSEGLWDTPSVNAAKAGEQEGDDLFQGIPVGIREFMATEKRIRDRKIARKKEKNRS